MTTAPHLLADDAFDQQRAVAPNRTRLEILRDAWAQLMTVAMLTPENTDAAKAAAILQERILRCLSDR